MNDYVDYSVMIASKGVDEINSGYIKASPFEAKTTCEYCKYGGLCKRIVKEDGGRTASKITKQTISDAVEYEKAQKSNLP